MVEGESGTSTLGLRSRRKKGEDLQDRVLSLSCRVLLLVGQEVYGMVWMPTQPVPIESEGWADVCFENWTPPALLCGMI